MNPIARFSAIALKGNVWVNSLPVATTSRRSYSNEIEVQFSTPNPLSSALKRGTGGRSSFNGNVVTVFGARCPLGRVLVSNLTRRGTQVIVPYRGDPMDVRDLKVSGDLGQVMFVPFYLRDEESLFRAVKYSNVVVNLIGSYSDTSFTLKEVHVDGAAKIAKVSRLAGVKKLIHMSALNARPDPVPVTSKVGVQFFKTKYEGEIAVRNEYPDAIIFRPSWMFGAADRFLNYYTAPGRRTFWKNIAVWNMGEGIYKEPVYFIDVCQGLVNVIFNEYGYGQTYEAVGPRRYELKDLIRYFNDWLETNEKSYKYVCDLKYSPMMQATIHLQSLVLKKPTVCWGLVELEHTTDKLTPGARTLVDLGVDLTTLESKAKYVLYPNRLSAWVDAPVEDVIEPTPPRYQPTYS